MNALLDLSPDDIWGIVAIIEKDFKHPLGILLYKEAIVRSTQRSACFAVTGEKPSFQKMGIMGEVVRTDKSCPKL